MLAQLQGKGERIRAVFENVKPKRHREVMLRTKKGKVFEEEKVREIEHLNHVTLNKPAQRRMEEMKFGEFAGGTVPIAVELCAGIRKEGDRGGPWPIEANETRRPGKKKGTDPIEINQWSTSESRGKGKRWLPHRKKQNDAGTNSRTRARKERKGKCLLRRTPIRERRTSTLGHTEKPHPSWIQRYLCSERREGIEDQTTPLNQNEIQRRKEF